MQGEDKKKSRNRYDIGVVIIKNKNYQTEKILKNAKKVKTQLIEQQGTKSQNRKIIHISSRLTNKETENETDASGS